MSNDTNARLYVGNLLYSATKDELVSFFARYGKVVELYLPYNKDNRDLNRGYCFVEFASPAEAAQAIEKMHGSGGPGDRPMVVRFAENRA